MAGTWLNPSACRDGQAETTWILQTCSEQRGSGCSCLACAAHAVQQKPADFAAWRVLEAVEHLAAPALKCSTACMQLRPASAEKDMKCVGHVQCEKVPSASDIASPWHKLMCFLDDMSCPQCHNQYRLEVRVCVSKHSMYPQCNNSHLHVSRYRSVCQHCNF